MRVEARDLNRHAGNYEYWRRFRGFYAGTTCTATSSAIVRLTDDFGSIVPRKGDHRRNIRGSDDR
jgi:hypothetical protein